MEIEEREIRMKVSELEDLCKAFGKDRERLLGYYKESAGFEGWTNYETYITYLKLCDDEHLLYTWKPRAQSLLNESVYRTYNGHMTPYESARSSLADIMKEHFTDKLETKWSMDPISKELLKGAYDVVNWYEVVDVLMEDERVPQVAESHADKNNVISLPIAKPNKKSQREKC